MPIFRLTYSREVVEETTIFVEADDEKLLQQNIEQIEECLDDANWDITDGDGYQLSELRELSPESIKLWKADQRIHKEHHFHYEDAEPKPEPPDPRQLGLFQEGT